jgi:hypothetical protein
MERRYGKDLSIHGIRIGIRDQEAGKLIERLAKVTKMCDL